MRLWILREKCPYSEFFWFVFSRIRTEYAEALRVSPYLVQCEKIRTRTTPNTSTFHAVEVNVIQVQFHYYSIINLHDVMEHNFRTIDQTLAGE